MHDLHRVDCGHGESRRLLVLMMELVKVFVEPRSMVEAVDDVSCVVLVNKQHVCKGKRNIFRITSMSIYLTVKIHFLRIGKGQVKISTLKRIRIRILFGRKQKFKPNSRKTKLVLPSLKKN